MLCNMSRGTWYHQMVAEKSCKSPRITFIMYDKETHSWSIILTVEFLMSKYM